MTAQNASDLSGQAAVIAQAVVDKLTGSVISSALPSDIGQWVRETCKHQQLNWVHSIPMQPYGAALGTFWTLCPDGTIRLELRDANGQTFWQGTFVPAEA